MCAASAPSPDVGSLLNTFVVGLGRETRLLQRLAALRTRADDSATRERMAPLFAAVDAAITRLENAAGALISFQDAHAAHSAHIAQRVASARARQERIIFRVQAIREHLPADVRSAINERARGLPERTLQDGEGTPRTRKNRLTGAHVTQKVNQKSPGQENVHVTNYNINPQAPRPQGNVKPQIQAQHSSQHSERKQASSDQHMGQGAADAKATDIPVIRNITEAELEGAPQYVKGRMTVARVAGVVASLNKVVRAKYTMLARPLRSLNSQEVNRWQEITSVATECTELEGRPFFTDADLRYEGVGLDSTAKSGINLLRHISALKEVRGKGVRIFIINDL